MDWNMAIEKNREALKRILASLVAMAEMGCGGHFTFFLQEGALPHGSAPAEKSRLSPVPTLPRHLHRAVLRLLRPAEAAARRLIIVAARDIVVAPPRPRKAKPAPTILRNGLGIAIVMPHARPGTVYFFPHNRAAGSGPDISGKKVNCPPRSTVRPPAFPLFDPLRRPFRRRRPMQRGVPRICLPGYTEPFPVAERRTPAPGDPIDVTRLHLRLAALASALDDLPAQARRFARWRARGADAARAQDRKQFDAARAQSRKQRTGRIRRVWPLRLGRPPGSHRPPLHQVHEILDDLHGLAFDVLERPDTS